MKRTLSVFPLVLLAGAVVGSALAQAPKVKLKPATAESGSAKWKAGETFQDCKQCPEMVVVPAGSFTMGSPPSERGRWEAEGPQHKVTIGYSFAVGKFPVTRDEYAQFAPVRGADFPQTGRDPVVDISWDEAKAYVAWLSKKTGKNYRLLSEAEYEYAERAGTTTAYWWGDSDAKLCQYANGHGVSAGGEYPIAVCAHRRGTTPAGSYPPNGFGLYDMAGNVFEWTEDCWKPSYAGAPANGTAWTSANCNLRVVRGGSWSYYPGNIRSAIRFGFAHGDQYTVTGFRVARTL